MFLSLLGKHIYLLLSRPSGMLEMISIQDFVGLGDQSQNDKSTKLATKAVFLLVGTRKHPIAYFLANKLSAKDQAKCKLHKGHMGLLV